MLKSRYNFCDLTHILHSEAPTWDGTCDFNLIVTKSYKQGYCQQAANLHKLGVGTHIDAPSHFCEGKNSIENISLESLVAQAHLINVSEYVHKDYQVNLQELINYEKVYGDIQKDSLVIFYTGWDKYWDNPKRYRNLDENGVMHFPTIDFEVAKYLVDKKVSGIGVDTLSPETNANADFPIHKLLLGNGIYILENLANCSCLPANNAQVIALPPKIAGAVEAPLRVIALIPKAEQSSLA